jgi:hypothetical protein
MQTLKTVHGIEARIQQEQELTSEAMQWIVCIAAAIIRAFGEGFDQNMTEIAQTAGMSGQTLYQHLRMAIESLHCEYYLFFGISTSAFCPALRCYPIIISI